jgi:hypothetical protein
MAEYAHYSIPDPEYTKVAETLPPPPVIDIATVTPEIYAAHTSKMFSEFVTPRSRVRYEPLADGLSRVSTSPSSVLNTWRVYSIDLQGRRP